MQRIIALVEEMYNLTYLHTDENGVYLFKCNDCGQIHRITIIAGVEPPAERQPVPKAFYSAFEQDDIEGGTNHE
jgi:hypothetical protein